MTDTPITNGDPVEIVADWLPPFHKELAEKIVEDLRSAGLLMEWRPIGEVKTGKTVLIRWKNSQGKWRMAKAIKIAPKTLEQSSIDCDWGEYDEDTDTYWTPPGWYEDVEAETGLDYNLHWLGCEPTDFMPLPKPPEE